MANTEQQVMEAMKLATETMKGAIVERDKLVTQVKNLTSERDIFAAEAEHWRALAYKLAGSNSQQLSPPQAPPAPMANNRTEQ